MSQLDSGLGQLSSKKSWISEGNYSIIYWCRAYTGGVSKLNTGLNQLPSGVSAYTNGVGNLATGANQLSNQSATLRMGVEQLMKDSTTF